MHRKVAITVMALSLGGCLLVAITPAIAQGQSQEHKAQDPKGGVGNATAPRGIAPSASPRGGVGQPSMGQRNVGQRNVGQPRVGQRNVGQPGVGQRNVGQPGLGQRSVDDPTIAHRRVGQRGMSQRSMEQRAVNRRDNGRPDVGERRFGQGTVGQGTVGQGSIGRAGMRGASIRDANKVLLGGRNYSIWRDSHRVRHGGGWRTFVTLSTLGGLAIGGATYYPYAYIAAPAPQCRGLTEDGCQLQWQQVQTLEGDVDFQCVAYCPWH